MNQLLNDNAALQGTQQVSMVTLVLMLCEHERQRKRFRVYDGTVTGFGVSLKRGVVFFG